MNQEELFRMAVIENDRRILSICRHFFGSGAQAEDAYQEILLKIWLNIKNFRGESQLKTWVNRIAVNVCLTFLSKTKKSATMFVPLSQSDHSDRASEDEADKDQDDDEVKIRFFEEFKNRLTDADKTLVTLYLEDIDYSGVAQVTGLSEVNARARIHRIKKQIKKEWEELYGIG
jgi:RNA polymerase sigma factor (sigma-70 family)